MDVYLLLGSNQGNRTATLRDARRMINERIGDLVLTSSIYSTEAWGMHNQPDFLNQVVVVDSAMAPAQVLAATQEIELALGRTRAEKWGPRVIDLDVLYCGDLVIDTPSLTVPHPQIASRRFTLAPLAEIAPGLLHPVLNKTQAQLLQECTDPLKAEKVNDLDLIA